MKKCLLLLVASLLFTGLAFALPADCQNVFPFASLSDLMGLNPEVTDFVDGCLVQDKLFSNFGYVQGGAGNPDASEVFALFSLTPGDNPPAGDLHTISFSSSDVSWTLPFTITYTVGVYNNAPPGTSIVEGFFDFSVSGGGTAATGTKTLVGNKTYTINAAVDSAGTVAIDHETSLAVTMDVNPNGNEISSLVDSYTQAGVPEPGTWALLGGGLVLLGALRRRRG